MISLNEEAARYDTGCRANMIEESHQHAQQISQCTSQQLEKVSDSVRMSVKAMSSAVELNQLTDGSPQRKNKEPPSSPGSYKTDYDADPVFTEGRHHPRGYVGL